MAPRLTRIPSFLFLLVVTAWSGCSSPAPSETLDSGSDADQRCSVDTFVDNQCDVCENAACCKTRFDCYDDHDCFYANLALDKCLLKATSGDAGADVGDVGDADDGGDAAPPTVPSCWDTFAKAGPVASLRYACERANCQKQCEVP